LNWLHVHFGFEHPPDIYHALLFQLDTYLKPYIENKLILRKELKDRIKLETDLEKKQVFEIQSELIKLMLNSCYGFTLCNITSNKFKMLENRRKLPNDTKRKNRLKSCIQLSDKVFLAELNKQVKEPFQTLLGHVGCYILYHSKIILLKRLYYLLKYLNPTHAQLLYMDTDSAHFLVKHKDFVDNVDDNYKPIFQRLYNKHFDSGNKISGIWVQEGFFDKARYIGEKSYLLFNSDNSTYLAHMKGLNQSFQRQFVEQNIDPKHTSVINYNIFQKTSDFMILKTSMSKNLFDNYVPIKRYFVKATGSLPLTLSEPY
jgi:DNA polymerase elongation subunit (family B)